MEQEAEPAITAWDARIAGNTKVGRSMQFGGNPHQPLRADAGRPVRDHDNVLQLPLRSPQTVTQTKGTMVSDEELRSAGEGPPRAVPSGSFRIPAPNAQPLRWRRSMGAGTLLAVAVAAILAGPSLWKYASHDMSANSTHLETPKLAETPRIEPARIIIAPTIVAEPSAQTPLEVRVEPFGGVPPNTSLQFWGLPPAISLSEGRATAGAWVVPTLELSNLKMNVATDVLGSRDVTLTLVGVDGKVLATARTALVIAPGSPGASVASAEVPAPRPSVQPERSRTDAATQVPTPLEREHTKPGGKDGTPLAEARSGLVEQLPVEAPPGERKASMLSPADREAAERLVVRGEREIDQGNIAVGRQFFVRAAQVGLARGALLLAATYDSRELARWGVQGVQPNLAEARKWYERARDLGAPEAAERLARLGN
jgi:hypothetical protein